MKFKTRIVSGWGNPPSLSGTEFLVMGLLIRRSRELYGLEMV